MDRRAESQRLDDIPVNLQEANKKHRTDVIAAPFSDAMALWQMSSLEDTAEKNSFLVSYNDVILGVNLNGEELEESLKRGGDGYIAEFRGGYLNAEQGSGEKLNLTGKAMSLCIRLKDPSGRWNAPIFTKYGGSSKLLYRLYAADTGFGVTLIFEIGMDFHEHPIQVSVPISMIGSTIWHDIIVRYDNYKLELFVDGVLVDEEWPIGSLRQGSCEPCLIGAESYDGKITSGFYGLIDHIALWNRALSDEEIIKISGGEREAKARKKEVLGDEKPITQYWKPEGHNTNVGDCMPFYHDGIFHLFYLFDRRHHRSKWGFGAHQWANASSSDLINWTHHPKAISITDELEGSICTGSVMFHQGIYYAFYATRRETKYGESLSLATSLDGINFTKTTPNPFASPEPPYRKGHYRDPMIFHDEQTGLFHLLITAELELPDLAGRGGCLAHLISSDLVNWDVKEPFIIPGHIGQVECPDYFKWNDWYYLVFSLHGVAHYRMSREPYGSWIQPKVETFDGLQAMVLKTSAFNDGRRIGVAFLPPDNGYGGNALFREIVQFDDGTLGTKFPDEMIPLAGDSIQPQFKALTEGVSGDNTNISINAVGGFGVGALLDVPKNVLIRMRIRSENGSSSFGLCLRGSGNYKEGHEIRFDPHRQKVSLRKPDSNPMDEDESSSINAVEGLDQPFNLIVIAKDDIIDLCINNQRTLVNRVSGIDGEKLFFFAKYAKVAFESIEVRPLL
jgi:beta-fructofuranosidase